MARLYLLAYFIFTSCLVAGKSTRYVLKGLEVSLKPGITGQPENILWMHNGDKVVEFNGQEEHVYDPFTNRITLNWITAELSITNLGFDDNGDYELEAFVNRKLYPAKFNLEVIEEVAKPSISCEMTEGSSSNLSATLVCAAEPRQPQSLIKFEWSSHGNTQSGSKLTIPLGEENDDEVYTCTVSNPLSMETATFTAKDCYPDKPSSTALTVSLVIVALTLLLVVLGIMCCKRHHKACFAKAERDDLEKGSKSGPTEGSAEEKRSLLNTSSTLPSNQPLHQVRDMDSQDETPRKGHVEKMRGVFESPSAKKTSFKKRQKEKNNRKHGKTAPCPPSQHNESPSPPDQNKLARGEEGAADADQLGKQQKDIPQSVKEPDPAEELANSGEDMISNQETSITPEQPELKEETEEVSNTESPTNGISPADQPPSSLTQTSSIMASGDTTGDHKEDTNSDQVNGDRERGCREADSSDKEKTNKSDGSRENEQSSTTPGQKVSDTTQQQQDSKSSEEELQTNEDDKQQIDKPVSAVENGSQSEGDSEEKDNQLKQDGATPSEPGNTNTSNIQESTQPTQDGTNKEEGNEKKDSEESGDGRGEKHKDKHEKAATSPPSQHKLKEETEEVSNTESPTNGISPADQPPSSLTQTSSIMASGDTTGDHKEDTNSDQVNGDSERGCREADSSDKEKTNKSDGLRENEQSSTTPGQKVSDTTQQQQDSKSSGEEPQRNDDNKQQIDKQVSAVENGSQSEGDSEEKDNQLKQDGATTSEPGNTNTSNIQESTQPTQDGTNKEEGNEKKDSEESGDGRGEKHKDKHEEAATSPPSQHKSSEPDNMDTSIIQEHPTKNDPDQEEEAKTMQDSGGSGDGKRETVDKQNEAHQELQ